MTLIASAIQVQTVEYDFARDGGAIGTINLGGVIPLNAGVIGIGIAAPTPPTSGGLATIELGINPIGSGVAPVTNRLIAATAFAAFGPADAFTLAAANYNAIATAAQVTMTIRVAALTSGKITFSIQYVEKNI